MYTVNTYNNISPLGLARFPSDQYHVTSGTPDADVLLLRSFNLHGVVIPESVVAIGRAGAGVNNIPVRHCSGRGIPVFNAPGANANAVKELVLAGMLIAARNLNGALRFVSTLEGDEEALHQQVEKGKKQFVGYELPGTTLGVIGLGAIGVKVANAAVALGMKVIGFDPALSLNSAWQLSSSVQQAKSFHEILSCSDFISVHVPLNDHTRGMVSTEQIRAMKPGAVILNFARDGIIDNLALKSALTDKQLHAYVCDFPSVELDHVEGVIALPHLGASTAEAEDNCAVMVVDQLRAFLESGTIRNSVNFPDVDLPHSEGFRLTVANTNVPNMVGQVSSLLAGARLNIIDLLNKSRGELAYTVMDLDARVSDDLIKKIRAIEGVLMVRQL